MARQKPSDKVETLKRQQAALAKQLKEAQAKADAEARETQRRKHELAGALALKELAADPSGAFGVKLSALLQTGVMKAADRALFELEALPRATKAKLADAGGTGVSGG